MADNYVTNPGVGGSTFRALEDGSSIYWPATVVCYATTVGTPDVLAEVTMATGLPVQPGTSTTWAATQSGTWNIATVTTLTGITNVVHVDDNAGSLTVDGTVAATQSGTWNIGTVTTLTGITNPVAATQSGAWNIGTVTTLTGITNPVAATQSGTWNIGTVTTLTGITNTVTCDTELPAAGALADATANPTTTSVGAFGLLYNGTTWDRIRGDTTNGVDVDVTRLPALAAGTALVGQAIALQSTTAIYDSTSALTPKFAKISAASSGDNTLVAAVASKKIRVIAMTLIAAGTVSIYFTSGAGGTAICADSTNKIPLVVNSGFVQPANQWGHFETGSGAALVLNLSAAIGVAGCLTYIEV